MSKGKKLWFFVSALLLIQTVSLCQDPDPLDIQMAPMQYPALEDAEKKDLLARIATQSYLILKEVPDSSLADRKADLLRIIQARKWLEATNDMTAWILAMILQYDVDSAILNEVVVGELFPEGSEQEALARVLSNEQIAVELLRLNEIDEEIAIRFALSNTPGIQEEYRKGTINVKHFRDRELFRNIPKQILKIKMTFVNQDRNESFEQELEVDENLFCGVFVYGRFIPSKEELRKLLLLFSLSTLESKKDVRLVFKVLQDDRKSVNPIIPKKGNVIPNETLRELIEAELAKKQSGHVIYPRWMDNEKGKTGDIMESLRKRVSTPVINYVELMDGTTLEDKDEDYMISINLTMIAFIRDKNVFSKEYQEYILPTLGCGHWLEFI